MDITSLFQLANYGPLDYYITMSKRFPEINPKNEEGVTPLHVAARSGQREIFEYIFGHTRERCPKTNAGITPFHLAAQNGHLEICLLIIPNIPNMANKNPRDHFQRTPLHLAAENGFLNICKLIIHNINDKNPEDLMGITPLHIAASKGHLSICELIIAHGVDKNPKELSVCNTPFHFAALNGHASICRLLSDGINGMLHKNIYGKTPLDWAIKGRKLDNRELIEIFGATALLTGFYY
jgi:ankyrin repeat protein